MKLVAYLRVSTIEQADKGYGLDVQRETIGRATQQLGATVTHWISDEGKSGALEADQRPGLTEALTLVRTGEVDGLIVRDLDRLARSVSVQEPILAEVWANRGAAVFTSIPPQEVPRDDPDDPYRTAMREMAGVFAGLERRLIVKRLRDGRKAKASNGGHVNGPAPYGWRTEKRSASNPHGALVPVPSEQTALDRMRQLHSQGVPVREIARVLDEQGHPPRHGSSWRHGTVARILQRDHRKAVA